MDFLKYKIVLYDIMTLPLSLYRNKYIPSYEHVGWPPKGWIQDYDEASNLIYHILDGEKPCLIGRYGSNEFSCMENFMKYSHPFWFLRNVFPFWVKSSVV